jgi:hypothetical protein
MDELRFRLWLRGSPDSVALGVIRGDALAAALAALLPNTSQPPQETATEMGQAVEDRGLKEALENQSSYSDARSLEAEKHDTNALTNGAVDAFEVAGDGNVAVTTAAGNDRTLAVAAGRIYPLRITHLKTTGTTATGVIGYTL